MKDFLERLEQWLGDLKMTARWINPQKIRLFRLIDELIKDQSNAC